MYFALYDAHGTFVDPLLAVLPFICRNKSFAPVYGQTFGETIARYRYDSDFDVGNILHFNSPLLLFEKTSIFYIQ